MNCGGRDFVCYLLGLLASHGVELSSLAQLYPALWDVIGKHIQAIMAAAAFSFGVWKWWRTRESVLHKRLREYLAQQDQRLVRARTDVVEAINKPGRERKFSEPLFVVAALRKVLARKNWEPVFRLTKLETSVERELDRSLRRLDNQLEAAEAQLRGLRHQQASAYFIKGAISSARAGAARNRPLIHQLDYRSLDAFRSALEVPGHEKDIELREYEAHQLS